MRKKFLFLKRSIRKLFFEDTCSCCQKELKKEESILCQECFQIWKKKSLLRYYEGHYYVHLYQEPIRSWIHEYKFQGRKEVFGNVMTEIKLTQLSQFLFMKREDWREVSIKRRKYQNIWVFRMSEWRDVKIQSIFINME